MGNASVIYQMNRKPREGNNGVSSTTETVFTSDGTLAVILPLPTAGQLGAGSAPGSMFTVRAWGRVKTSATANFTVALYYGTSTTVADNTKLSDSGAVSLATLTTNWCIEGKFVWDGDSNRINGRCWNMIHGTVEATVVEDNLVTSADPDANATRGFVVSWTFGTGSTTHTVNLDGFQLVL